MKTRNYYTEIIVEGSQEDIVKLCRNTHVLMLSTISVSRKRKSSKTVATATIGTFNVQQVLIDLRGLVIRGARLRGVLDPDWICTLHAISSMNKETLPEEVKEETTTVDDSETSDNDVVGESEE